MQRNTIILLIMALLFTFQYLSIQAQSVATADDLFAPFINPSALSVGNASGIAFIGYHDKNYRTDDFYLSYGKKDFSFVYGKVSDEDNYQIAMSRQVMRNFYFGSDIHWTNKHISNASYGLSLLSRPHNAISLGMNVTDITQSDRRYLMGMGVKPPGFTLSDRLAITADFRYEKDEFDAYQLYAPKVGLETHLINGLMINAGYDIEAKVLGFNISMVNRNLRIGNRVDFDDNREFQNGSYYVNLSERSYPSPFFLRDRPIIQKLSLKRKIVEEKQQTKFGPFTFVSDQLTLIDLITEINDLKDDDRISGIILKNPRINTNYANIEQLRRTFLNFRDAGKRIIVYSNGYGNVHYAFFASIADELYLNPNGGVFIQGFSITIPYLNEMFAKIGIDIFDLKSHDYKTGLNIFTNTEMTDYEKETYELLLTRMFAKMKEMIDTGRNDKIKDTAETLINNGPYLSASQALELGLVDRLIYEDELEEIIKEQHHLEIIETGLPDTITTEWFNKKTHKIAIINAVGNISMGDGQPGRTIGSETLSKQIRNARNDNKIKGIILRIDSGGGSAYASDIIAREVKLCREEGKPVVVSMSGAAASGGYYIAAYADKIVAENTTITGSIGVTGMIPNFKRLFDKLSINWDNVSIGDNADLLEPYFEVKEEDLTIIKNSIADSYELFVRTVSKGRGMHYGEIDKLARGRVWSGYDAKRHNLIDEIGGIDRAVELMKEMIGYDNIELADMSYSYRKIPLSLSADQITGVITGYKQTKLSRLFEKYYNFIGSYEDEPIQYRMFPYEIEGID